MKTQFDHGTVITPAFMNAINTPVFSENPQNDGELPLPPLSLMTDVQSAIAAEASRAANAEAAISDRIPKCTALNLTDLVNQWEIVSPHNVWTSGFSTVVSDGAGLPIYADLDFNWCLRSLASGAGVRGISFISPGNSISSILFDFLSSLLGGSDWGPTVIYGTAHLNGDPGIVTLNPLECVLFSQGTSSSTLRFQVGGVSSERPVASDIYRWGKIHLRVPLRGAFGS